MNNRERDARGRNNSGSLPGELCPMYGRTGPAHPMYGKKHTEEAKAKISAGLREYYKK